MALPQPQEVPSEPDDDAVAARLRKDERRVRAGVIVFAVSLLAALTLSMQLSTLGVSFGTLVYGTQPVWPGHGAVFRVGALDPYTNRLVPGVRAVVTLEDHRGAVATVAAGGGELAEVQMKVPADFGEGSVPPQLRVVLDTDLGQDEVTVPLRLQAPQHPQLRVSPHWESWTEGAGEPKGDLQVALYPDGGEAVRGLDSPGTGWVTDKGRPVPDMKVRSELMGMETRTDALGMFEFNYHTPLKPEAVPLTLGDAPGRTVKVPLDFRPVQMWMEVTPGPWAKPGDLLTVRLQTLPFQRPIHVDVWLGDVLLLGTSEPPRGTGREMHVALPAEARGWVRISAYRLLGSPAGNLCTRWVWVSESPPAKAAAEALAALENVPGTDPALAAARSAQNPHARQRFTELVLSRLQPATAGMPLLRNNLSERQARVEERVGSMRSTLNVFFAVVMVFGVVLAGTLVLRHQLRMAAGLRGVMEEGIAAGEAEIEADKIQKLTRVGHAFDLGLVLGILLLAAYGIWVLLQHLYWL